MTLGKREYVRITSRQNTVNGCVLSFNGGTEREIFTCGNHMVEQGKTLLKMTLVNFAKRARRNLYSTVKDDVGILRCIRAVILVCATNTLTP